MGLAAIVMITLLQVGSTVVSQPSEWDVDEFEVLPTNLRTLDDTSFEHDTQAATGQTTGSWLVLFTGSDCATCDYVEATLLQIVSRSEEGMPILAKVSTSESPRTAKRFNVLQVPQLKLFRDRHMFSYRGQLSAASIATFVQDEWRILPFEEVPKEVTLVYEIQEKFYMLYNSTVKYLGNRPGILASIGSMTAMGGYVFTKKWLVKKQNQKRLIGRAQKEK